jgi:uncharacterized membrane protein (DUF373 family)
MLPPDIADILAIVVTGNVAIVGTVSFLQLIISAGRRNEIHKKIKLTFFIIIGLEIFHNAFV